MSYLLKKEVGTGRIVICFQVFRNKKNKKKKSCLKTSLSVNKFKIITANRKNMKKLNSIKMHFKLELKSSELHHRNDSSEQTNIIILHPLILLNNMDI